jgi:glutamyl/glutaminyl-tRNA synthetase
LLSELADRFEALDEFTLASTEDALGKMAEEHGIKKAKLIHPTRLAVSGVPGGPGLYDILVLLTKPVVIERMRKAVKYIENKHS